MFTRYIVLIDILTEVLSDLKLALAWYTEMWTWQFRGLGNFVLMLKIKRIWHYFNCSASLCTFDTPFTLEYLSKTTFLYTIKLMKCNHFLSSWLTVMPRLVWIQLYMFWNLINIWMFMGHVNPDVFAS